MRITRIISAEIRKVQSASLGNAGMGRKVVATLVGNAWFLNGLELFQNKIFSSSRQPVWNISSFKLNGFNVQYVVDLPLLNFSIVMKYLFIHT